MNTSLLTQMPLSASIANEKISQKIAALANRRDECIEAIESFKRRGATLKEKIEKYSTDIVTLHNEEMVIVFDMMDRLIALDYDNDLIEAMVIDIMDMEIRAADIEFTLAGKRSACVSEMRTNAKSVYSLAGEIKAIDKEVARWREMIVIK